MGCEVQFFNCFVNLTFIIVQSKMWLWLPCCLAALLPCCLAALLPCCPAALLPGVPTSKPIQSWPRADGSQDGWNPSVLIFQKRHLCTDSNFFFCCKKVLFSTCFWAPGHLESSFVQLLLFFPSRPSWKLNLIRIGLSNCYRWISPELS